MIAIITGDIINSRKHDTAQWINALKNILSSFGNTPKDWEIYRGDSFQLKTKVSNALKAAILIKACIKQYKAIDVRIAIGIGEEQYTSEKITESNGSAYANSGECFENLKKSTMAIKSSSSLFDKSINIMLDLALLTMNHWTPTSAKFIMLALQHPEHNQSELASMTKTSQGNFSRGLKRGGYDEILKLLEYYNTQTMTLWP